MKPKTLVPSQVRGFKFSPFEKTVSSNDLILYALGIGFSQDPMNRAHFKFTYENEDGFQAFPTIPVLLGTQNLLEFTNCKGIPEFNFMNLLHGEENVEMFAPIKADEKIVAKSHILDVQDKGKNALIIIKSEIKSEKGEMKAIIHRPLLFRGLGGFGDKGTYKSEFPPAPQRTPDHTATEKTQPNQAILYRLSGDVNPLHIDPDMAAMGGFDKPILHGLCTFGFAMRAAYDKFCNGDPSQVAKTSARFTSHVFPGETLVIDMWKEGRKIVLQAKTQERGKVVLIGFMEVKDTAAKL